jgi:NAD(P)H-dependent FMN reductase
MKKVLFIVGSLREKSFNRQLAKKAEALLEGRAEVKYRYPGHVKNLLDWLSRPVKSMDYATPTCINGKKVAISGAGGKAATANCRQKLTELLEFLKADVLPLQTGIALQPECWATDTLILTDEDQKNLAAEAEAFLQAL